MFIRNFRQAGFTLVELLVVIAIGAIITTMSISIYSKVLASGSLTIATQMVTATLEQARQTAVTRNAYVEVRIYELPLSTDNPATGPLSVYRAFQTFLVTNTGYTPLSKVLFLPTPLVVQCTPDLSHSSLLDSTLDSSLNLKAFSSLAFAGPPVVAAPSLPTYGNNYAAITFRFTPKGSLTLDASKQWFLTVYSPRDKIVSNSLPANYATIQIDAYTGKSAYFRP